MKKRTKIHKNVKKFLIVPIVMSLVMGLTALAVSFSAASDALAIGNMFFSDNQVDYSNSFENIFVPTTNNEDTIDASEVEFPNIDKQFGELKIKGRDVDAKLFFGDGKIPLRNGVGVYAGSFIPGYGKTILVAGHNNTYFNGLKNVKKGDIVKINTSYGNYEYKVRDTKLYNAKSKKSYDLNANKENLILYTCYPFDTIGLTEKRFFVYADKISGPKIVGLYD
jgi:sortase A